MDAERGIKVAIAESDVDDYPGLWLRGNSNNSLSALFPPYPLKEQLVRDRDLKVIESADYIAVTRGKRTFPWRLLCVAERSRICEDQRGICGETVEGQGQAWIKPGKVAWDCGMQIFTVDSKPASTLRLTILHRLRFEVRYRVHHS